MVNGVVHRLLICGLDQGVMRHSIERQIKKHVRSLVQRAESYRAFVTLPGRGKKSSVLRIRGYTKSQQLLYQRRLGRIPIPVAPNMNPQGPDISDIECISPRQFALDTEIPVIGDGIAKMSIQDVRKRQTSTVGYGRRRLLRLPNERNS